MKTNSLGQLSAVQLRKAAELADNIERQQNELTALLTGQPVTFTGGAKGSRFTPAQRKKISEGQKAKWAERKAAKAAQGATPASTAPQAQAPAQNAPVQSAQAASKAAPVPVKA